MGYFRVFEIVPLHCICAGETAPFQVTPLYFCPFQEREIFSARTLEEG